MNEKAKKRCEWPGCGSEMIMEQDDDFDYQENTSQSFTRETCPNAGQHGKSKVLSVEEVCSKCGGMGDVSGYHNPDGCIKCGKFPPDFEKWLEAIEDEKERADKAEAASEMRFKRMSSEAEGHAKARLALDDVARERDQLKAELAELVGCPSCHHDHPPSSMCPPFEVRTTGLAAIRPIQWRQRYTKLERKFIQLQADYATLEKTLQYQTEVKKRTEQGRADLKNFAIGVENGRIVGAADNDKIKQQAAELAKFRWIPVGEGMQLEDGEYFTRHWKYGDEFLYDVSLWTDGEWNFYSNHGWITNPLIAAGVTHYTRTPPKPPKEA